MELDIALYDWCSGGGVVTSPQLSLERGPANGKISDVSAAEKIREQNPDNKRTAAENKPKVSSLKSCGVTFMQLQRKVLFYVFIDASTQCLIIADTWHWFLMNTDSG